jgi:DNA polymerase III delta' subunit
MDGARTRGHAAALAAVGGMVRGGAPHAILLSGPGGVGKTTLAMDLAAGLLCVDPDPAARPCRACRGCRLLENGDHPDLHRLAPEGPGGQVLIGGPPSKAPGVRDLLRDLLLLPLEGGARVAVIESADRMNEAAQGALLKSLEETPDGVTFILCADEVDRLAPTVRSRCARIRLGPVGVRDLESILAERGLADAPLAARLARLAGGRPGVAIAYARAPEAVRARAELARSILDLLADRPARRLVSVREMLPIAMAMASALDLAMTANPVEEAAPTGRAARRPGRSAAGRSAPAVSATDGEPTDGEPTDGEPTDPHGGPAEAATEPSARTVPAAVRRRAAEALVLIWIDVARDLALVGAGGARSVRDPALLEDLTAAAADLPDGASAMALGAAERAATLLAANASPELVLDVLALDWPVRRRAA